MLSETIPIQTYMGIYRKPHIDYTDVYWNDRDFPGGSDGKESTCNALWSLDREDTLEKGMATHSSVLAWRIPWTEEPGRLQGLQIVGHEMSIFACHTVPIFSLVKYLQIFCYFKNWAICFPSVQFTSHSYSAAPWIAAPQASLSITNSWSLLKLMSIESVMPLNHLILCCPLLLLPSIFPSIRVFSNESALRIRWPKYWSFNLSISPANKYSVFVFLTLF